MAHHPRRWLLLLAASVTIGAPAAAQTTWTVDSKSSLSWWQISPHMNHLWATTCPQEPSWRPGEGRTAGWAIAQWLRTPKDGDLAVGDTIHVPLYPRYEARDVCTEAVRGEVTVPDTVSWRGVRGEITVQAHRLVTGHDQRDEYARDALLEVAKYPEIKFRIDSLVNPTRQADTLLASAMGVLSLHGVDKHLTAAVRAWPEAGGVRILGRFRVPAQAITREFGISNVKLGLGVGMKIWQDLFMGVDLLMRAPKGTGI